MKKFLFVSLFVFLSATSFAQEESNESQTKDSVQTLDEFVELFYQTHKTPEKLFSFFDPDFYSTYYKFVAHMDLKNERCGDFKELKLKRKKVNKEGDIFKLKYSVKYEKCRRTNKLTIHKNPVTKEFKIHRW